MSYYLMGQQCVLISRHTDCTDNEHWTEKSACVVSSVLGKGLHISTLISRGRKTWAGDGWRAWGGGVAGKPRPELDFNENLCVGARGGCFRRWSQPGGRGLMHAPCSPSPLTDRSSFAQNARRNRWLSPRTRLLSPRAFSPPPRAKSGRKDRNRTEILRRTFSFFLHTCATVLTHWLCYMIGSTIDIRNIINIGSIFHGDICNVDL